MEATCEDSRWKSGHVPGLNIKVWKDEEPDMDEVEGLLKKKPVRVRVGCWNETQEWFWWPRFIRYNSNTGQATVEFGEGDVIPAGYTRRMNFAWEDLLGVEFKPC